MFNQHRIMRVFQLINMLKSGSPKSVNHLAKMLETTDRSVYRYLDLLRELGFDIQRDRQGRYLMMRREGELFEGFTEEEATLLKELLLSAGKHSKLKDSILQKIQATSETNVLSSQVFKAHLGKIVQDLSLAIQLGRQVVLKKYHSANSLQISDRFVEPVRFTENYISLCAFEVSSGKNKYFNIERIAGVEVLDIEMKNIEKHRFPRPDVFGFSECNDPLPVDLRMSLRAFVILREEFPMTIPFLKKEVKTKSYRLQIDVNSYKPVARFALGLPDDVEVMGPPELREYLKQAVERLIGL